MMAQITGTGCSLGALVAASVGANIDETPEGQNESSSAFYGALAAHSMFTAAAVRASARTDVRGPGGLSIALMDELAQLAGDPVAVMEAVELHECAV